MYRYCVACLVLASLGGCAANPPAAATGGVAAANLAEPAVAANAVTPVDAQTQAITAAIATIPGAVKTLADDKICEPTTLPGSRIVVGQTCYSPSARAANTQLQVDELRREQDMLERAERDREQQRQRASMQAAFP